MNENNIAKVDLNLLKSLSALLEERHVGRAAAKMNVTQSAMSHTLAKLRTTFDDPLFTRTAKGLEPTARTEELSLKLKHVLNEIDQLFAPKQLDLLTVNTRFKIQTHDFLIHYYLRKVIKEINRLAPNIIFDIQTIAPDAYEKIENGDLDMLIGAGLKANPRFIQKYYTEENLVCVLDESNPVLHNWNAESIFKYPHIKSSLVDDSDDPVVLYGNKMGFNDRKIGLYAESLSLQLALIPDSVMIAFIPKSVALIGTQQYGLFMKTCPFPLPAVTVRGLWHERNQKDLVHKWVRDKLSEAFSPVNSNDEISL